MPTTTTPAATPLLCRLNVHHKWRMEYPTEGPKYGWCIGCRKVNPTWSGWEWKDLLWMRFPSGGSFGTGNSCLFIVANGLRLWSVHRGSKM